MHADGTPAAKWDQVLVSPPTGLRDVDRARAVTQWEHLCATLEAVGATVETIPGDPVHHLRTFVRDLALPLPDGRLLVPSPHRRRAGDELPLVDWFARRGWDVVHGPALTPLEGGNVFVDQWPHVLVGSPPASSGAGLAWLTEELTPGVVDVLAFTHPELAHLDLVLGDLGGRGWVAHRAALRNWEVTDVPVIDLDDDEARGLLANLVVRGDDVVGAMSDRTEAALVDLGTRPHRVDLDAFVPVRGGARCLTLPVPLVTERFDRQPSADRQPQGF
jgi:N-dimethylarginine dimethylaminohydrolase